MAITRMKQFATSKKPYAIDWDSFEVDTKEIARSDGSKIDFSTVQVNAVWVGRKDGRTYVSAGQLWGSEAVSSMTRDEFMANFDPRYGGRVEARWNGHDLWAPGCPSVRWSSGARSSHRSLTAYRRPRTDTTAGTA